MKLLRLSLQNFKGIRSFTLDLDGRSASVYGRNGLGKTTLKDAYFWLLFGKDSAGRTDSGVSGFDVVTRGTSGSGLEYSVEGAFLLDDGRETTLRRVYLEQFSRAAGESEPRKTGNTTKFYIDGLSKSKTEYTQYIAGICPDPLFLALSDPDYLPGRMKPEERRKLLFQYFAPQEDSIEDFAARHSEFQELLRYLNGRSVEDFSTWAKEKKSEITKRLKAIPERIDATEQARPASSPQPGDGPLLAKLQKQKIMIEKKISDLHAGGADLEIRQEITELQEQLSAARMQYSRKFANANNLLESEASQIRREIADLENSISACRRKIADWSDFLPKCDQDLADLRGQWAEESGKIFDESDTICPTCGQAYPPERMQEARARFNMQRADKLEEIEKKGKELAELAADTKARLQTEQERLAGAEQSREDAKKRLDALMQPTIAPPPFEESGEYRMLSGKLAAAQDRLSSIGQTAAQSAEGLENQLTKLESEMNVVRTRLAGAEQSEKCDKTIAALKDEQKRLGQELAETERGLFLAGLYKLAQAADIEEQINGNFTLVRWKLFDTLQNGESRPCCEASVQNGDGQYIEYGANLNDGARVNAGLDIISALSKKRSFSCPVWIDRAGEVTDYNAPLPEQIVRLYAKARDESLRVEVQSE